MKNYTTKYFCRKFFARSDLRCFARKFDRMRECYDAVLRGEAGDKSAGFAIWIISCGGVMNARDLRLFAISCIRKFQQKLDAAQLDALAVAEKYANGSVTDDVLENTYRELIFSDHLFKSKDINDRRYRALCHAIDHVLLRNMTYAISWIAEDCGDAAEDYLEECNEQLRILAKFGNPFEEVTK